MLGTAQPSEERFEGLGALVTEDVVLHLEGVPQPRVDAEVVDRAQRSGFEIRRTEDGLLNSGVQGRASAHGAWFERAYEHCIVETPGSQVFAGVSHREYLGVCSRVTGELSFVVPRRDDLTVDDDERPDRNVSVWNSQLRFGKRKAHKVLVFHSVTLPNLRAGRQYLPCSAQITVMETLLR